MMHWTLSDMAAAIDAQRIGNDCVINGISIDTRTLQTGQLYLAIAGDRYDGHAFIEQAEQAGAAALLLQQPSTSALPQLIVADTRIALGQLAASWRQKMPAKLIGVTGSNGKTTVKEMLAAICNGQGPTLATQGNLNNDIGVPLTLLQLQPSHDYAVIEMGANHPGEIAYTSVLAAADVVVINNVGAAHIEGFGDLDGVARSKGEIIDSLGATGTAILNRDDHYFPSWLSRAGQRHVISFGFDASASVSARNSSTHLSADGFVTTFDAVIEGQSSTMQLQLAGDHNVKNALAATAAALAIGLPLATIQKGLRQLQPVTGRMQPLTGRLGNWIIDDSYNANPSSLAAGLAVLPANRENWVVLGAFGELGNDSPALHRDMGQLLKQHPVSRLLATGDHARYSVEAFGDNGQFFETQADLIAALQQQLIGHEILFIKGSRAQHMERVVAALVDHYRTH
jgi:UDP-N-acetylmuramoyl-tripeptide--D-alanyl-D-alanine ligase